MAPTWKHKSRYKHHYDRIFSKEEILDYFGPGWHQLILDAYTMMDLVPTAIICSAKHCSGMIHMYVRTDGDNDLYQNAAEGIAWKVERLSAVICEHCGKRGKRRKEFKKILCLCNSCYMDYVNNLDDPLSVFRKGRSGRF